MTGYFQLRIPRDLKEFFDGYVKECKPLGIPTGNELMRYILISKANELQEEMNQRDQSKAQSSKNDSIAPDKRS